MANDAFGDALDSADEDDTTNGHENSDDEKTQNFIDRSNDGSGVREATVGFAVTEEMHYLYRELSDSDEVDADLRQQFRDQIERVANRFPEVANRARKKYELDNE